LLQHLHLPVPLSNRVISPQQTMPETWTWDDRYYNRVTIIQWINTFGPDNASHYVSPSSTLISPFSHFPCMAATLPPPPPLPHPLF
jgi:hypothetical protein